MSDTPAPVDESLEALEEKIRRTVGLVAALRRERQELAEANSRLEARLESEGADGRAGDLADRLARTEKERARLLQEKRAFLRRIEDILAKLEFLESESAPR